MPLTVNDTEKKTWQCMISRRFNIKLKLMLLSSGSEKLSITCQLFKDLNIQWICVNKTNHTIRWIAIYLVNSIIPIVLSTFRTTQARSLSQSVTGIKYLIIAQDKKNLPVFKSLEEIPLVVYWCWSSGIHPPEKKSCIRHCETTYICHTS